MNLPKWKSTLVALLVLVAICAIGTWYYLTRPEAPGVMMSHFRNLEQVEFCTIRPRSDSSLENPRDHGNGDIEGYAIVDILPTNEHRAMVDLLRKADKQNNTTAAKCFDPRHALRDPTNNDNYVLICFKCYQMRYSFNGNTGLALITDGPKRTFNAFISQHSLKTDEGDERPELEKASKRLNQP